MSRAREWRVTIALILAALASVAATRFSTSRGSDPESAVASGIAHSDPALEPSSPPTRTVTGGRSEAATTDDDTFARATSAELARLTDVLQRALDESPDYAAYLACMRSSPESNCAAAFNRALFAAQTAMIAEASSPDSTWRRLVSSRDARDIAERLSISYAAVRDDAIPRFVVLSLMALDPATAPDLPDGDYSVLASRTIPEQHAVLTVHTVRPLPEAAVEVVAHLASAATSDRRIRRVAIMALAQEVSGDALSAVINDAIDHEDMSEMPHDLRAAFGRAALECGVSCGAMFREFLNSDDPVRVRFATEVLSQAPPRLRSEIQDPAPGL